MTNIGDLLLLSLAGALTLLVPVDVWIMHREGVLSVRHRTVAGAIVLLLAVMLLVTLVRGLWVLTVVWAVIFAIWAPVPFRR